MYELPRLKFAAAATFALVVLLVPVLVHGTLARPRISADSFWKTFGLIGLEVEHYSSVGEMAEAADAVILGSVGRISLGRAVGGEGDWVQLASVTITVHEVLDGALPPEHSREVTLELVLQTGTGVGELKDKVPQVRHVFFLRNKGLEVRRLGYSEDYVSGELPYYRLVTQRAVLAEIDGRVHAPGWAESADFLTGLQGRSFEDFVGTLRGG